MHRILLKSKIHRATVTQAELHYIGSITIDCDLMEAADIVEFERMDGDRARIRVRTESPEGAVRFERVIDGRDTREVILFIDPARDQIRGSDGLPFKVVVAPRVTP